MANTILWIYIVLLIVGGVMGLVKAGSKVSLIMSAIFAVALSLCALGVIRWPLGPDVLLGVLLLVFVMRFVKTKKFMPAGFMIALTLLTLIVRLMVSRGGTV